MTSRRVRPVHLTPLDVIVRRGAEGVIYMESPHPLGEYPVRITDRLEHWAREAPDRIFLAERDAHGEWQTVTYGAALQRVRALAQALLDRRLSQQRPLLILSGNSIHHGLLALAAMYVGVLYAPVAPAYSLQARDFTTIERLFTRLPPALVFAADGAAFRRTLERVLPRRVELLVSTAPDDMRATRFADLERTPVTRAVDEARAAVGPDTIAKILFTSGSTGQPKGVINTQRMLCSNQEMIRATVAFLGDAPPVLCDWLPWNHTAGGNHNFGLVLYNGGTLYIDEGKPTPQQFGATLRNLREIAACAHFTVPRTYEMLMPHLRTDPVLREMFFRKLQVIFYAAAGLGPKFWDELRDVALDACGEELLFMTGFGATETAPFAFTTGPAGATAGAMGLPAPGMKVKLAPVGGKIEARVKGPNITLGYWRDEALTAAAFDDEGFYRMGDAVRFVDPEDPGKGLLFDGRLAEDFKLSTGTWVSVGPLRARILAEAGGCALDAVITGHDREFVGALIVPNLVNCRALAGLGADATAPEVLAHRGVAARFQQVVDALAAQSTGSSTFVARALVLEEPPSLDARELTDKGSLNQKRVLEHRAALVEELYDRHPSDRCICATIRT
jgi:feruloyl-CoA synthase